MATIPASLQIVGQVHSDEDLVIEGSVRGDIHLGTGTLTIGERARIDGDIRAPRIHVRGAVSGAVSASERIEIAASGSVKGNLSADHVIVIEGAVVNGHVDMNRRTIAARVARQRPT